MGQSLKEKSIKLANFRRKCNNILHKGEFILESFIGTVPDNCNPCLWDKHGEMKNVWVNLATAETASKIT